MGHMKFEHLYPYEHDLWQKNNIRLVNARVLTITTSAKSIELDNGLQIRYDRLVIATGSLPNKVGWPGHDLEGVLGLYSKQDLDYLEVCTTNCRHAVVVGGGLIGIEVAEMLRSRNIAVTMLVREASFWGNVLPASDGEMINRHIREHKVNLRLSAQLKAILPGNNQRAAAVETSSGEKIDCDLVALTTGVSPNIAFLEGSGILLGKGVKVNRFLETNVPEVYAIGDCAEQTEPQEGRKPIEAVWYTGKIMGETLARTLCGNKTAYAPGHWFNSAKFFDIEYQTYGRVAAKPGDGERHFYWKHGGGKKAITIAYHPTTKIFQGINCYGIRMRHDYFNQVLEQQLSVNSVVSQLAQANFDPEFYSRHEREIRKAFEQ